MRIEIHYEVHRAVGTVHAPLGFEFVTLDDVDLVACAKLKAAGMLDDDAAAKVIDSAEFVRIEVGD